MTEDSVYRALRRTPYRLPRITMNAEGFIKRVEIEGLSGEAIGLPVIKAEHTHEVGKAPTLVLTFARFETQVVDE